MPTANEYLIEMRETVEQLFILDAHIAQLTARRAAAIKTIETCHNHCRGDLDMGDEVAIQSRRDGRLYRLGFDEEDGKLLGWEQLKVHAPVEGEPCA